MAGKKKKAKAKKKKPAKPPKEMWGTGVRKGESWLDSCEYRYKYP